MTDWADEKAQEWLALTFGLPYPGDGGYAPSISRSIAALLREVKSQTLVRCCVCDNHEAPRPDCECVICHRQRTLAEVRKIVEEVRTNHPPARECFDAWKSCDEILSRIEGLDG